MLHHLDATFPAESDLNLADYVKISIHVLHLKRVQEGDDVGVKHFTS